MMSGLRSGRTHTLGLLLTKINGHLFRYDQGSYSPFCVKWLVTPDRVFSVCERIGSSPDLACTRSSRVGLPSDPAFRGRSPMKAPGPKPLREEVLLRTTRTMATRPAIALKPALPTTDGSTITVARSSLGGLTPNGPLRKPIVFTTEADWGWRK